ncbi:MAG: hypothetical protein ABI883_09525 [Chthoniobacterales bacterium]
MPGGSRTCGGSPAGHPPILRLVWASVVSNLKVGTPAIKSGAAIVEVALMSREMGKKLRVTLLQKKGTWKVDKVAAL